MEKVKVKCWKEIGTAGDGSCPKLGKYYHCRNCPEFSRSGRLILDREVPREAIKEWTERFSKGKDIHQTGKLSVALFRLGTQWLALRTKNIEEIISMRQIHKVPFRTNNIFEGLVNVGGELLTCINLKNLIEAKEEENDNNLKNANRIIVIRYESERYVFVVDEIQRVLKFKHESIKEKPATMKMKNTSIIDGIIEDESRSIGLIDDEYFFAALKRSMIW